LPQKHVALGLVVLKLLVFLSESVRWILGKLENGTGRGLCV